MDHEVLPRHGAAQAILADGFRDWSGSYALADGEGTPLILTGVFISDRPLSANDGSGALEPVPPAAADRRGGLASVVRARA